MAHVATPTGDHRTALILGGSGVIGSAIASQLADTPNWTVYCASRSGRAPAGTRAVQVDLLDPASCAKAFAPLADVTDIFYTAYVPQPSRQEEILPNRAMLANAVDAIAGHAGNLRSVVLVTGAKYYGIQWGPIRTPALENGGRSMGPNFYYAQEDFLKQASAEHGFDWYNIIPPFVSGYSESSPMNLTTLIGVYASLSRELGLPLQFPGPVDAYNALSQLADADQIAAAAEWASRAEDLPSGAYNVANGDPHRWNALWPELAAHFNMACDAPRPFSLAQALPALAPLWESLAKRHGLKIANIHDLIDWNWADYMLRFTDDVVLATNKIRAHGFDRYVDTAGRLKRRMDELVEKKIIPPF